MPLDMQVKATHQLVVEPIYPGLLQLQLKSMYFLKNQPHLITYRFTTNTVTENHQLNFHQYKIFTNLELVMNFEIMKNNLRNVSSLSFKAWSKTKIYLVQFRFWESNAL
jgi:hypothetical protein